MDGGIVEPETLKDSNDPRLCVTNRERQVETLKNVEGLRKRLN